MNRATKNLVISWVCLGLLGCSSSSTESAPATGGAGGSGGDSGNAGAGSAGSGGNATGGGPTVVHGDCDDLGPKDTFEDITPPGVLPVIDDELGVVQVRVDPVHTGTLYAGTDHRGLFKSTDCGASWTKLGTGKNGEVLDSGILWSFEIDPSNPDVIWLGSLYSFVEDNSHSLELWKSENGGVDWKPTFTSAITDVVGFFQEVSLDPTNPQHLVVTFHEDCSTPTSDGCVGETTDGGATWHLRPGPFGFAEGARPRVFGPQTWLLTTPQGGVYATTNAGESYEDLGVPGMNGVHRTQAGVYYAASDFGLWSATDPLEWSFHADINGAPVTSDGERLFLGIRAGESPRRYYTSPESDGVNWTEYAGANEPMGEIEVVNFAYDTDHHVLYSANTRGGLWRVVTR